MAKMDFNLMQSNIDNAIKGGDYETADAIKLGVVKGVLDGHYKNEVFNDETLNIIKNQDTLSAQYDYIKTNFSDLDYDLNKGSAQINTQTLQREAQAAADSYNPLHAISDLASTALEIDALESKPKQKVKALIQAHAINNANFDAVFDSLSDNQKDLMSPFKNETIARAEYENQKAAFSLFRQNKAFSDLTKDDKKL